MQCYTFRLEKVVGSVENSGLPYWTVLLTLRPKLLQNNISVTLDLTKNVRKETELSQKRYIFKWTVFPSKIFFLNYYELLSQKLSIIR